MNSGRVAPRRPGLGLGRWRRRWAWAFLLPTLTLLALVAGWPLLRTVYLGFTDAALGDLAGAGWVGLENFRALLADPDWWRSVANTLIFTAASVTLETVLGLGIALVLDARIKGQGVVRAAVLIPWAIPTVVSAKMWAWMLNDLYGVVNAALLGLGLARQPIAWLADDALALGAVIAVDVWKTTPFVTLLLLAGLKSIPRDVYEAAKVDGASPIRVFFSVTLPLLRPALVVAVIFRTLDALRVFDVVYVLMGNARATATMSIYARQQLVDFQDAGYGSAVSTLVFLVIAAVTVVYLTAGRLKLAEARP